ncbi:MAG: stage II sporulation protein M [Actinomycetaceae bacterium]|nr:stage II sporulation protein M [Actinomycetaceae bacterium]
MYDALAIFVPLFLGVFIGFMYHVDGFVRDTHDVTVISIFLHNYFLSGISVIGGVILARFIMGYSALILGISAVLSVEIEGIVRTFHLLFPHVIIEMMGWFLTMYLVRETYKSIRAKKEKGKKWKILSKHYVYIWGMMTCVYLMAAVLEVMEYAHL